MPIKKNNSAIVETFIVALVLFNTALCWSAFSTVSFGKLVFRLSLLFVFFVLNQMFWTKTLKYELSYYVTIYVIFFPTLYKSSPFLNTKLFIKTLYCKNMLSEKFWVFQKNSFIKKSVEQSKYKECKRDHKVSQLRKFIKYQYSTG